MNTKTAMPIESKDNTNTLWKWLLVLAFVALLPLAVISILLNNVDQIISNESSIQQLTQNSNSYFGRSVVVSGEVDHIGGNRAFILNEGSPTDDEILVLSRVALEPQGGGPDELYITDGQTVRVIGTMQNISFDEAERELGIELEDELKEEFENAPIIVADLVEPLPSR